MGDPAAACRDIVCIGLESKAVDGRWVAVTCSPRHWKAAHGRTGLACASFSVA